MISDVLSDAVIAIDEYLDNPIFNDIYTGEIRKEIDNLRAMMDATRQRLDTLPADPQ